MSSINDHSQGDVQPSTHAATGDSGSPNRIEQARMQEIVNALNSPVIEPAAKPGAGPMDGVDSIAQKAAQLVIAGQESVRKGDVLEYANNVTELSQALNAVKDPDVLKSVLARVDSILEKSNLKLAVNSSGEVWEGRRDTETSPYYPLLELVASSPPKPLNQR
jgi:hypothetical protein